MKADIVVTVLTTLPPEEVMVRAVQFFTNERWRTQSQTNRIATFVGTPKVPLMKIILMLCLLAFFVVPGIIYYILILSKVRRLQNIVVTTSPTETGCSVVVTYPKHAQRLVDSFVLALPGSTPAIAAANA
jgi:hypothetical protein